MAQEYDEYGDSSYSKYPTDDNKYQCRTGPFEGFFVSSVEFFKHVKFDVKDDIIEIIIEQEPKVHLVLKAYQELMVLMVLKVYQVHKAHQDQQEVNQVRKAQQVLKVKED